MTLRLTAPPCLRTFRVQQFPLEARYAIALTTLSPYTYTTLSLTSGTYHTVKMSLQAPSLSLRSKSPSRNSGSTKAVILVLTFQTPNKRMHAHNCRSEGRPAAQGSGLCLWNFLRCVLTISSPQRMSPANPTSHCSPSPATPSSNTASAP